MVNELNTNISLNNQLKWELFKYEVKRFTIFYCKQRTKRMQERESVLKVNQKKLRIF